MKIVLLTHPDWLESQSMPRFAEMIKTGMTTRGHEVTQLTAQPQLLKFLKPKSAFLHKWIGYFDQFVMFPRKLRKIARQATPDTLFVVVDQALGMWVPSIRDRPHVIHCHDFMALHSAMGRFAENLTGITGKTYQWLIRRGFSMGNAFLCVSEKTRSDLLELLSGQPRICEVVHNGLRKIFRPMPTDVARDLLSGILQDDDQDGFLLHVGGNQWYKNRPGVIRLYREWCRLTPKPIPLWLVGAPLSDQCKKLAKECQNGGTIRILAGLSDEQVVAAYHLARLLIFPSLAEGFGWPIVEAMECGTPVLTTNVAPMNEVGGMAAFYHSRLVQGQERDWALEGAGKIASILALSSSELQQVQLDGFNQSARFGLEEVLGCYEKWYEMALTGQQEQDVEAKVECESYA